MYKIVHISDTHVMNYKYHKEYRTVFEQMYEKIRQQRPDAIIHCGDIAHTKVNLSPEYFELAGDFLKNLADIAPLIIILGNHDGNLRNTVRQDAITPIVKALKHPNIFLRKGSGEYPWDKNITFNVLSVFDPDNWVKPTNPDKINIALYHGSISGCETSLGWVMEHGENDISIFEGFDYAMLGDIHKTNQSLDDDGRVRYCGNTIQNSFSDELDKGYLLWNIRSKDDFDVELHTFQNPKPFITIELTSKGKVPKDVNPPEGSRIRIVSNNKLPVEVIRKATDVVRTRFKPESITFLNRAGVALSSSDTGQIKEQNLRDPQVQQELIRKYLADYNPDEELLKEVFSLNEKYNKVVEEGEEVARNVNWSLKSFEWDNLFCFGEGNKIDFDNVRGLVGIFGKNYSGKSSIIDALLYTIFNSTSKNIRKNVSIVNDNKQKGRGKVEIQVGTKLYTIERITEKYEKKLRGETTVEAKTDVKFSLLDLATGESEILDAIDRNGTDAKIRHTFGTLEDFLTTSMSSQMGALDFINEGSTRRKEILAKFLDLDFFDKKFKLAKEDSTDTKGYLKKLETYNLESEEEELHNQMDDVILAIHDQEEICSSNEAEVEVLKGELAETKEKLNTIPTKVIDPVLVNKKITGLEVVLAEIDRKVSSYEQKIKDSSQYIQSAKELMGTIDEAGLEKDKAENTKLKQDLTNLLSQQRNLQQELEMYEKQVGILDSIPCGDKFKETCPFISSAFSAKESIPTQQVSISNLTEQVETTKEKINENKSEETLNKLTKLKEKVKENEHSITSLQLQISREGSNKMIHEAELTKLREELDYYEQNKEAIINAKSLQTLCDNLEETIKTKKKECLTCREKILHLHKQEGSIQAKIAEAQNKKKELDKTRREFSAYDLFMRCMHSNGIAFDVTRNKLPAINESISEVLANVTDFNIFFENSGNKLDIFIQHKDQEPRPLELGSGAEKTLAAMAIRIALLNVSNAPKSSILVMDEPATALDANNMEGFTRVFEMAREHFTTTLLITHIESLKDNVDKIITIEKRDGYAYVEE